MSIEHIRVSQRGRDHLLSLKRRTGIKNWNVLCRWAFCKSLAEPSIPPFARIPADSNVEMSWKVFAGANSDIYTALLRQRCHDDGLGTDDETLAAQFRLHLHRGIGYLAGDKELRSAGDLVQLATTVG